MKTKQKKPARPAPASRHQGRGPGRSLEERVSAMEAHLAKLRQKSETQLLRAAEKARLFDFQITAPQLQKLLVDLVGQEQRPPSLLQRKKMELEQIKARRRNPSERTWAAPRRCSVASWWHNGVTNATCTPNWPLICVTI